MFSKKLQAACGMLLLGTGLLGVKLCSRRADNGSDLELLSSQFERRDRFSDLQSTQRARELLDGDETEMAEAIACQLSYAQEIEVSLEQLEAENESFRGLRSARSIEERIERVREDLANYHSCGQDGRTILTEREEARRVAEQGRVELESAFEAQSYDQRLKAFEEVVACFNSLSMQAVRQEKVDQALESLQRAHEYFRGEEAVTVSTLQDLPYSRAKLAEIRELQDSNLERLRQSENSLRVFQSECESVLALQVQAGEKYEGLAENLEAQMGAIENLERVVSRIADIAYREEIARDARDHLQHYRGLGLADFQELDLDTEAGIREFHRKYSRLGSSLERVELSIEQLEALEANLREQRIERVIGYQEQTVMQQFQRIVDNPAYQERRVEECGPIDCFGRIRITRRRRNFFTGQEESCCMVTRGNGQARQIQQSYEAPVVTHFVEVSIVDNQGQKVVVREREFRPHEDLGWTEWKPFGDTHTYQGIGRLGPRQEIPYLVE